MKIWNKIFILLVVFTISPIVSDAAQVLSSMRPRINIVPVLSVSVAPLDFGSARTGNTGQLLTSTQIVVSNGFNALPISIAIDNGQNVTGTTRRLISTSTGSFMPYTLFRNAARSLVWNTGNTGYATTINGTTGGMTVYATADYTAALAAGTYTDTLTVTVTY